MKNTWYFTLTSHVNSDFFFIYVLCHLTIHWKFPLTSQFPLTSLVNSEFFIHVPCQLTIHWKFPHPVLIYPVTNNPYYLVELIFDLFLRAGLLSVSFIEHIVLVCSCLNLA